MYAGTKVNWHEVLVPSQPAVEELLPLFLCAFSSDKGPEKITELTYADFSKLYGTEPSFAKYGQPSLQAYEILQAGGKVLGKRIVASDSALSNIIVSANITTSEEAKVDDSGNPIYLDADGNETTTVTDTPATVTKISVKYTADTIASKASYKDVLADASAIKVTDTKYPLFVVCDNGRGVSAKAFSFEPSYTVSRFQDAMIYNLKCIEGTTTTATDRFSINPDFVLNTSSSTKASIFLSPDVSDQFDACCIRANMDKFIEKMAELTGYTTEELYALDVIYAKDRKGNDLGAWTIDTDDDGIDLQSEYGIELLSGSNGSFGDSPWVNGEASEAWATEAVKFFDGTFNTEIFDLDQHKIDFCCDANYPMSVKHAITELATFREDFFYFRDLGRNISNIYDIESIVNDKTWEHTPFVGDYATSYDIYDPYTYKQITVTMIYGIAPTLVSHYSTNVAAPIAGEYNNFIISNAIKDTINFIPRITPNINQKEILDDMRVNFANMSSNTEVLAVQSTYTSQDHYGPLSFSSNVIITQMCIKAIRRYTPKIRFMLTDDDDFTLYKTLIDDNVINDYKQYFRDITLVYTADDAMTIAKIFNASLYCYYKNFAQGEIFDVFAIEGSPSNNPITNITTA